MKIFITGGAGFIGTHVIRKALEADHEVTALCRPGSRPRVELPEEPNWLKKSLDQVEAADLVGVDVLVHLAAVGVSPQVASWQDMFYWNVTILLRLLAQAHEAHVRRVVIAGSFAEYGRAADHYDRIPVDAPLLPTSGYAASKAAGSIAALAFARECDMELFYLRIFSVYGEGQYEGNFWPALRLAALAGQDFPMTLGAQVRDYVPVEQVASDIVFSATTASVVSARQTVLNIGSGKPITMLQFAERWWEAWSATGKLLPGSLPYRSSEPMRFVPLIDDQWRS